MIEDTEKIFNLRFLFIIMSIGVTGCGIKHHLNLSTPLPRYIMPPFPSKITITFTFLFSLLLKDTHILVESIYPSVDG